MKKDDEKQGAYLLSHKMPHLEAVERAQQQAHARAKDLDKSIDFHPALVQHEVLHVQW